MLRRILVQKQTINHLRKASFKPFSTGNYKFSERQFTDGFKAVEVQQTMQASEFQNYSALFAKPEKEDDESNMPKGFEKFLKKAREGRKSELKQMTKRRRRKRRKRRMRKTMTFPRRKLKSQKKIKRHLKSQIRSKRLMTFSSASLMVKDQNGRMSHLQHS